MALVLSLAGWGELAILSTCDLGRHQYASQAGLKDPGELCVRYRVGQPRSSVDSDLEAGLRGAEPGATAEPVWGGAQRGQRRWGRSKAQRRPSLVGGGA